MIPAETPLTVVLLTYGEQPERAEYAYRTTLAVLDNLHYSGPLYFHIADDGSPQAHRDKLYEIAGGSGKLAAVTVTNAERGGYGRSWNLATMVTHLHGGTLLMLEDDWVLDNPLDADPLVSAIGDEIQCIRLGYLGWTEELRGKLIGVAGQTFLLLDPDSPSRDVFAGHPRIETVDFQRRVGEWPIGQNPGLTEFIVCGRPEARRGVAWPMQRGPFGHIGSVQARTDQQ